MLWVWWWDRVSLGVALAITIADIRPFGLASGAGLVVDQFRENSKGQDLSDMKDPIGSEIQLYQINLATHNEEY